MVNTLDTNTQSYTTTTATGSTSCNDMTHLGNELLSRLDVGAPVERATLCRADHEKPVGDERRSALVGGRRQPGVRLAARERRDRGDDIVLGVLLRRLEILLVACVGVAAAVRIRTDEELAVVGARHLEMQRVLVPRRRSHIASCCCSGTDRLALIYTCVTTNNNNTLTRST